MLVGSVNDDSTQSSTKSDSHELFSRSSKILSYI